jgi:CheY-like chemotaxis protein
VRYLGSNDINERTYAVITATRLGSDAVLPMIELLASENVEVRRNAVAVLARLKDQRAIPALLALTEHEGEDELVVKMAGDALAELEFDRGYEPANALDAYLHLAKKYYRSEPGVILNFDAGWTVWSFQDGELVSRDVPRFLYGYKLAEEAAFDAIMLDPADLDARVQLALVAFAQKASVDAFGASAGGEELEKLREHLAGVTALAASQGVEVLNDAAMRAIAWGDTGVAREAMTALAEAWDGRPLTEESALVQGLSSDDKGIRYAAVAGLAHIAPQESFPSMELVMPIIADAVSEGSHRQILVIEPDPEIRSFLLHELNGAGYYAVGAEDGAAGLLKAKTFSVFDLILLRSQLPDITAFQVAKELREDFRTRDIPVMMLTANAAEDRELFKNAAGFVSDPRQPELYLGDVKNVMSASLNDDREKALAVSLAAANVLAGYKGGILDPTQANVALADTLAEKPDNIRLAALEALARFGTPDVQSRVLAAFMNTANSVEIRTAAARALGQCVVGQAPTAETYEALLEGMGAEELELRIACGGALGKMDLTPEQRVEVLKQRRLK